MLARRPRSLHLFGYNTCIHLFALNGVIVILATWYRRPNPLRSLGISIAE